MQPVEGDVPRLFHGARALKSAADRAQYLEHACGADLELRARLETLLRADDEAGDFLVRPAQVASAEQSGQMIGRYKLLQQIGEGGFGTVWMAEQREPVRRRVALKVIKLGMDTKQVVARFEAERQALALMDHPSIARVFDGGATEAGRPYFVMELVKGVPIVEYCDTERLDTRARLTLFVAVCNAIQHAHQKGVIHRDIKPSNVLVTLHDGVPVPKVIDFGIAKATQGELTSKTLFTEHGQIIGTPAYMSPEQAQMSGLDIDTRTDVYSLGVLLYELLTGTTPFATPKSTARGFVEVLRAIREDEPERPSTRISMLGLAAARTAEQRKVDPKRLGLLLRGDLDWIVLCCLEKDRTRRYESASGLAGDVLRHLAYEPVLARPPSRADRLRKFARRNRAAVAAAATVALVLVLGAAGTTLALLAERTRARELEQVGNFQSSQLASIDAARMGQRLRVDLGDELRLALEREGAPPERIDAAIAELGSQLARVNLTNVALQSLDENVFTPALDAIARDFGGQPLVEARLLQTLARTLGDVGLLGRATAPQERALAIRREELGVDHPDTLLSLDGLGDLLREQGRLGDAEPILRDVLARRRRLLAVDDVSLVTSVNNLGALLHAKGERAEAELLLREALASRLRTLPSDHSTVLAGQNNLGVLLHAQNRLLEAEELLRAALAGQRRVFGDDDPLTLSAINNLSSLLKTLGRLEDAESLAREAIAGRRRVLGDDHLETLTSVNNLGALLLFQERLDEAEPLLREALAGQRRHLGEAHPNTLSCLGNLAALYQYQGRAELAAPLLREGFEACRSVLGDTHQVTLVTGNNLGQLLMNMGDLAGAEPILRDVHRDCLATLGPEHSATAMTAFNLGLVLRAAGALDEADELFTSSLAATRAQPGVQDLDIAMRLDALGQTRLSSGRPAEAETPLRESLVLRIAREPEGWRRHDTASMLGESLARQGRHDEADPLLVAGYERIDPPAFRAGRKRDALVRLVDHYKAWERPDEMARYEALLDVVAETSASAK